MQMLQFHGETYTHIHIRTWFSQLNVGAKMWSNLQKRDVITHFADPDFCIIEFHIYVPKALFYTTINAVLQIIFESQGWIAIEAIH